MTSPSSGLAAARTLARVATWTQRLLEFFTVHHSQRWSGSCFEASQ